jgi:hypothetical protein
VHANHVQAIVSGEAPDLCKVGGRRTEARDVLGRPEVAALVRRCGPQPLDVRRQAWVARPDDDRNPDQLIRWRDADTSRRRKLSYTSPDGDMVGSDYHRRLLEARVFEVVAHLVNT